MKGALMEHDRFAPLDAAAVEQAARRNYYEEEAESALFWRRAAASLPPHARRKYAHLFEAAERWEPVIDFIVEFFRQRRSDRTQVKGRDRWEAHA
jgi:hypothetical protein